MVLQQVLVFSLSFQVFITSLNPTTACSLFLLLPELPPKSSPICEKENKQKTPHGLRAEAVAGVGS